MSKLLPLILVPLAVLSLEGCRTWIKPGADGEMWAEDQQRCENETGVSTGKKFVECMERAGWHHGSTSDAHSGSDRVVPPNVEVENAQLVVQDDEASRDNPAPSEVPPPVSASATERRQVGGWIQFGEETDQLEAAKVLCDSANAADEAFGECMQSKGWRQIKFRITVEEPDEFD